MERFWAKVDKGGPVVSAELGPCWVWTASTRSTGYGSFFLRGKLHNAHRVSWELEHGAQPEGLVLHRCDNPLCVRPDHLFDGTHTDNVRDMMAKGRNRPPCIKGEAHPRAKLSEEQVRLIRSSENGYRILARRFGVSKSLVRQIRTGKIWRHVA